MTITEKLDSDDIDDLTGQFILALMERPVPDVRELAKIAMRTLYRRGWRPTQEYRAVGPAP
jgi:hypothetical protein